MMKRVLVGLSLLLAGFGADERVQAQCPMEWADGFGVPGLWDTAYALAVYDDGSGPALYVGGKFEFAGDMQVNRIVKWDGSSWSSLGSGVTGNVYALTVFKPPGSEDGPRLYVAGDFATAGGILVWRVAAWDGQSWSALGEGVKGKVYALAVFDDGSGPALYAGGKFKTAGGGETVNYIAKWDGQSWSALGSGMYHFDFAPTVNTLAVYDDGTGPALYAAGHFTRAGGVDVNNIAKWDGQSWSPVDGGLIGGWYDNVRALTVYDDGSGPALYAGGWFVYAGWVVANGIARWDGQEWSALGSGVDDYAEVNALTVYDDGAGPALYVGGEFSVASGVSAEHIAKWDGQSWSALAGGVGGYVHALTVFDPPGGEVGAGLYAAGSFGTAGDVGAYRIARWDGSAWSALGEGNGMEEWVEALCVFDPPRGDGAGLYAGGFFSAAGGSPARRVARWDGASWSALGSGLGEYGQVSALTVYDDGTGPALYVGGGFSSAGGVEANNIARWDGSSWSALGSGIGGPYEGLVYALGVFDPPGEEGPGLYVGGQFETASGVTVNNIARWDGSTWSALGSGMGEPLYEAVVHAMVVFDDGSGAALYVGGQFAEAGGITVNRIARWDGQSWSAVGGGVGGVYEPGVQALRVFDDGSGSALYVGGWFTTAGGISASSIARWDGENWWPLGSGVVGGVAALAVFDDGSGPALYVGGDFEDAGGVAAHGIAKWDGSSWSPLGEGIERITVALCVYDDGGDRALYGGGFIERAGPHVSAYIAKWGCVEGWSPGDLNCDGAVDPLDVNPFVLAVSDPAGYEARFPDCLWLNGDINADNRVDFGDIRPFIELLSGGDG